MSIFLRTITHLFIEHGKHVIVSVYRLSCEAVALIFEFYQVTTQFDCEQLIWQMFFVKQLLPNYKRQTQVLLLS